MLIYRYCVVILLKTMKIINSPICAEVLSIIISEFKLCLELHYDLQFYRPRDYRNWISPPGGFLGIAVSNPVGNVNLGCIKMKFHFTALFSYELPVALFSTNHHGNILPGFKIQFGSKVCFTSRITSSAMPCSIFIKRDLPIPTPCSPVAVPFNEIAFSTTLVFIS